jgi:excisionase family DNA binding protein
MESSKLFSVEEAAERLGGVSRWTVYTWMSQRRLRKTKIGSRVMIAERDLQDFIARCNPEAQSERNRGDDTPARQQ